MRGRLIVFEGGDATGKSTQARLLAEHLGALLTRQPGGTAIGAQVRELVLDPDRPELADRTEALLMAADRAQHVAELVAPTLDSGRDVVSERFVPSSIAYQGVGRGLGVEVVAELSRFATDGLTADLVVLLEVPDAEVVRRLGTSLDRIEAAGGEFRRRVLESYRSQAAADPDRWVTIAADREIDEVAADVIAAVDARLGRRD